MRTVSYEYKETPAGIAQQKMFVDGTLTKAEDFAIDIPVMRDIDDFDLLDGYDHGEKW